MARVINDFITINEIQLIKEYFKNRPFEKSGYTDTKNLHWEQSAFPKDLFKEILQEKVVAVEGPNYKIFSVVYTRSHQPYRPHVDSKLTIPTDRSISPTKGEGAQMIIPLEEGDYLNTLFWKKNFATTEEITESINNFINLPDTEIKHNNITSTYELDFCATEPEGDPNRCIYDHYELDINFNWKVGTAVHWNRHQLHASTDFTKHVPYKDSINIIFD